MTPTDGTCPDALGALRLALGDLYVHDRVLFRLRAGETTLTSRLAHHLVGRVDPSWDVDAEYHVQGTDGAWKIRGSMGREHMRPDLLVHRRGLLGPEHNLLMVEVKRSWALGRADAHDEDKARVGVSRVGHRTGVALALQRRRLPRVAAPVFDPRWTVYEVGPYDPASDRWAAVLAVDHEPVFGGADLDRLEQAAERHEEERR